MLNPSLHALRLRPQCTLSGRLPSWLPFVLGLLAGWQASLLALDFVQAPGPYPHGLTSDGQVLWVADYETRTIFKLDQDGHVIFSFISQFGRPRGLALHATSLYVATSDRVVEVDAETGKLISDLASPDPTYPDHQGLAYGDGKIYFTSPALVWIEENFGSDGNSVRESRYLTSARKSKPVPV